MQVYKRPGASTSRASAPRAPGDARRADACSPAEALPAARTSTFPCMKASYALAKWPPGGLLPSDEAAASDCEDVLRAGLLRSSRSRQCVPSTTSADQLGCPGPRWQNTLRGQAGSAARLTSRGPGPSCRLLHVPSSAGSRAAGCCRVSPGAHSQRRARLVVQLHHVDATWRPAKVVHPSLRARILVPPQPDVRCMLHEHWVQLPAGRGCARRGV